MSKDIRTCASLLQRPTDGYRPFFGYSNSVVHRLHHFGIPLRHRLQSRPLVGDYTFVRRQLYHAILSPAILSPAILSPAITRSLSRLHPRPVQNVHYSIHA